MKSGGSGQRWTTPNTRNGGAGIEEESYKTIGLRKLREIFKKKKWISHVVLKHFERNTYNAMRVPAQVPRPYLLKTSLPDRHSRLFNYTYYKRPVTRSAIRINVHILETGRDKSVIEASRTRVTHAELSSCVSNCWANKPIGKRTIKSRWHTHYRRGEVAKLLSQISQDPSDKQKVEQKRKQNKTESKNTRVASFSLTGSLNGWVVSTPRQPPGIVMMTTSFDFRVIAFPCTIAKREIRYCIRHMTHPRPCGRQHKPQKKNRSSAVPKSKKKKHL